MKENIKLISIVTVLALSIGVVNLCIDLRSCIAECTAAVECYGTPSPTDGIKKRPAPGVDLGAMVHYYYNTPLGTVPGAIVDSFGTSCVDCVAQGYPNHSIVYEPLLGWTNCFGHAWIEQPTSNQQTIRYRYCMFPALGHSDWVIPENHTADLGSSTCPLSNGDSDPSNLEDFAKTTIGNQITIHSSLDLKSGNVYHSQEVGPLTFSYNSQDISDGPLGPGWTHNFDLSIMSDAQSPEHAVYYRRGDGNRVWFNQGPGTTGYTPDAKSRNTSQIVKNPDGTYIQTTKYSKVYYYDASGRLSNIVDRNAYITTLTYSGADLTAITDSTGRMIAIGMNGGKIVSVADFGGNKWTISYSQAGLISSITDPIGNSWRYQYDSANRMVQKTDPANNTCTYAYDSSTGKLTSSTDPNGLTISLVYSNEFNSVYDTTTVTQKDGGVWVHKYYKEFNVPVEITDPLGNKTSYKYDSQNNLLSITYPDGTSTSYTYENGNVKTVTDPAGHTTTLSYNDPNNPNRVTDILDPENGTTHITYDAKGNVSSIKDPTNALTQIGRDTKGNITSIKDPLNHVTQYTYDTHNFVESVTDPTGVVTSFTNDIMGNVLTRTDALGKITNLVYDDLGQLETVIDPLGNPVAFEYDENGNRKKITDALHNPTYFTYNYRGQPTTRADALGKLTQFTYVSTGCATCSGGGEKLTSLTDAAGSITGFEYDKRGLLTKITDPLQKLTNFEYNSVGLLTKKTDRNQIEIQYTHTPTGRLATVAYPDNSGVTNTYDKNNRLTQMSDSLGESSFTYDGAGRVTSYTDPHGFTLGYTYDLAGNLTEITYPDQTKVIYEYDATNRLKKATNSAGDEAVYTYDANGRLWIFKNFNGITTTYTYDDASRLTGMTSAVASYQFTLDPNGNRIQSIDTEPLSAVPTLGTTTYTYNDKKNRLLSAGDQTYGYDDEGNLISAGGVPLMFDCEHRLLGIGSTALFDYDGRGNRLRAVRSGVATRYIYDPFGNLLAEADDQNQITRKYIYGGGLIAMAMPDTRYCYHFNATGSTIALTDMTGAVVNSYAYEPFGKILAEQETVPQPFKFVGQYGVMAEPNGLYYMRARYYDPSVGRFISEDPLGFGGGDVNLYAYVLNDPIGLINPSGKLFFPWHFAITLKASLDSGRGLGDSLSLAWGTVAADFGTQGYGSNETALHGMSGITPDYRYQSTSAAVNTAINQITDPCSALSTAKKIHSAQDLVTPSHGGELWTGFHGDWTTVSHVVGDLLPSPNTIANAYLATRTVLKIAK